MSEGAILFLGFPLIVYLVVQLHSAAIQGRVAPSGHGGDAQGDRDPELSI